MYPFEKNDEKVNQFGSAGDLETLEANVLILRLSLEMLGPKVMTRLMGHIQDDLSPKVPSPCPLLAVSKGSTDWRLQAFALLLLTHGRPCCGKDSGLGGRKPHGKVGKWPCLLRGSRSSQFRVKGRVRGESWSLEESRFRC